MKQTEINKIDIFPCYQKAVVSMLRKNHLNRYHHHPYHPLIYLCIVIHKLIHSFKLEEEVLSYLEFVKD
jgi:hypothetical protein